LPLPLAADASVEALLLSPAPGATSAAVLLPPSTPCTCTASWGEGQRVAQVVKLDGIKPVQLSGEVRVRRLHGSSWRQQGR
jgi:hypothetical protein